MALGMFVFMALWSFDNKEFLDSAKKLELISLKTDD